MDGRDSSHALVAVLSSLLMLMHVLAMLPAMHPARTPLSACSRLLFVQFSNSFQLLLMGIEHHLLLVLKGHKHALLLLALLSLHGLDSSVDFADFSDLDVLPKLGEFIEHGVVVARRCFATTAFHDGSLVDLLNVHYRS